MLTGLSATGSIGTISFITTANVSVTGVQSVGQVGTVSFWLEIDTSQTPNWIEIAA
jgi:hypothetical protein